MTSQQACTETAEDSQILNIYRGIQSSLAETGYQLIHLPENAQKQTDNVQKMPFTPQKMLTGTESTQKMRKCSRGSQMFKKCGKECQHFWERASSQRMANIII